jgi:hypothetical protein
VATYIGDAFFNVYPNTDRFLPELTAAVKRATAATRGRVPVSPVLDKAAVTSMLGQLNAALKPQTVPVSTVLDAASLLRAEAEVKAAQDRMTVNVPVNFDLSQIAAANAALQAYLRSGRTVVNIPVRFDTSSLPAANAALQAYLHSGITSADIPVRFDPASITAANAVLQKFIRSQLGTVDIPVMFSPESLSAANAHLQAYLRSIGPVSVPAKFDFNWLGAAAQALTFSAALKSIGDTLSVISARNAAVNALVASGTGIWMKFLDIANAGWANLGVNVRLFAGVFDTILPKIMTSVSVGHLLIDWIIEFAAVLGPAIIAVGAFGAAIAPVVSDAIVRFQAMQQAASALGVSIGVMNYNARGGVGPMQALQNALQPTVWELTGDALNIMNARMGTFQMVVRQVNTVVQDLAARMTAAFTSSGFSDFMKNGALDAQRFGTIIGNLGGAFGNIAKAVPGYAMIIEQAFVELTAAIEKVTSLTIPLMNVVMAFHGFILYVGLAATAGVALTTSLANGIAKMFTFAAATTDLDAVLLTMMYAWEGASAAVVAFGKNMLALALNPYVVAIAALGAVVYDLVINWNSASASVAGFTRNITTLIGTMQGGQALQEIPNALGQINAQLRIATSSAGFAQVTQQFQNIANIGNTFAKETEAQVHDLAAVWNDFTNPLKNAGKAVQDFGTLMNGVFSAKQGIALQVQQNVAALQQAFNQIMAQDRNLLIVTGQLMQGTVLIPGTFNKVTTATFSWAQALGILNAAGVQASDSLQTMQIKVAGFLQGWSAFGLNATQIGNSVNALALQAEMGQTSIQKLTSAYSNFIGVVTSGETAFGTFGTGLGTLSQALSSANASGVTFTSNLGKFRVTGTAVGATMNGISQASLGVRSAFAQEVTNAQNLYNALLTMSSVSAQGAHGQDMLAQSMKDMVAELLPLAQNSPAALSELSALAQVAGGPATDSFKALSQWVGNIKNPMADLNKQEQALTTASANLYQDTMNLAGAMNQTLTTAISNAILAAKNGPQALNNLATAMNNFATGAKGSSFGQMEADLAKAIPTLELMTGSAATAKAQFLAMAGALHIDSQTANELWAAATKVSPVLDAAAKATQQFTSDTNANRSALASATSQLGMSGQAFNKVWAAIMQENQALIGNTTQVSATKNAFLDFAQNGLHETSNQAQNLWKTAAAQNLTALAGKASTTESSFAAFAKNGLNLTASQAEQLWTTLRLQYLDTLASKASTSEASFVALAKSGLGLTDTQAQSLWTTLRQQYLDTLATKAGETESAFVATAKQFGVAADAAKKLWDQLHAMPTSVTIPVNIPVNVQISQAVASGAVSNQVAQQIMAGFGAAGGGIAGVTVGIPVPHMAPGGTVRPKAGSPAGKDSQLIMAAPGELIVPASHAPAFGDMARKAGIPGFAGGGMYTPGPGRGSGSSVNFQREMLGAMPYSYYLDSAATYAPRGGDGASAGLPLLNQYQGNTLIQLLTQQNKLLAQMPYTYAQAISQAQAQGVRRGYFATSG